MLLRSSAPGCTYHRHRCCTVARSGSNHSSMSMAHQRPTASLQHGHGIDVEMESRFFGLRDISEKEGTFEADIGVKVRWGPTGSHSAPRMAAEAASHSHSSSSTTEPSLPAPYFYITETLRTTEIEHSKPTPMANRPQWSQMSVRTRTTSQALFKLQNFPYDLHKLRVLVRVPGVEKQGIHSIKAVQESKSTPRAPDLGLQDWLVLRQRCYMRTVAPGNKWFLRIDAPTEYNDPDTVIKGESPAAAAEAGGGRTGVHGGGSRGAARGRGRGSKSRASVVQQNRKVAALQKPKVEFVMEFLVQRRATYWVTSVYLPLLAMELIVPMTFAMPVADLSNRLVMAVTLVIAPAVFKSALADRLPSVGYLTTMDKHFIFVYIFILASCVEHTALRLILDLGYYELAFVLNSLAAGVAILVLLGYHYKHYTEHFQPYVKRLGMFERRSFYAPAVITTAETWSRPAAAAAASSEEREPVNLMETIDSE